MFICVVCISTPNRVNAANMNSEFIRFGMQWLGCVLFRLRSIMVISLIRRNKCWADLLVFLFRIAFTGNAESTAPTTIGMKRASTSQYETAVDAKQSAQQNPSVDSKSARESISAATWSGHWHRCLQEPKGDINSSDILDIAQCCIYRDRKLQRQQKAVAAVGSHDTLKLGRMCVCAWLFAFFPNRFRLLRF